MRARAGAGGKLTTDIDSRLQSVQGANFPIIRKHDYLTRHWRSEPMVRENEVKEIQNIHHHYLANHRTDKHPSCQIDW